VAIENIGAVPMDSIGVDYYIYDSNRNYFNLKSYKADSLRVGQYIIADMKHAVPFGWAGIEQSVDGSKSLQRHASARDVSLNNYGVINLKLTATLPILSWT
jgi:hypothetical protein